MAPWHDEFPQDSGLRYLNHAAVAPWPKRAGQAVTAFAEQNVHIGARDYPQWLGIERRLRERLMRLLNAPSTAVVPILPSATAHCCRTRLDRSLCNTFHNGSIAARSRRLRRAKAEHHRTMTSGLFNK